MLPLWPHAMTGRRSPAVSQKYSRMPQPAFASGEAKSERQFCRCGHESSGARWQSEPSSSFGALAGESRSRGPCRRIEFLVKSWLVALVPRHVPISRSAKGRLRFSGAPFRVGKPATGPLLLPMREATTLPLSAHRDALAASGARLVLPAQEDVLRAFNKEETVRLATSLGIAVPKTTVVCNPEQAREAGATTKFPAVLKPRSSVETHSDGAMQATGRPLYARNAEELQALYLQMSRTSPRVLVQEFVDGEGTGYFALMHHGELRAEFAHRRIRDVHPTGSGSALRVSVEPDPHVRIRS